MEEAGSTGNGERGEGIEVEDEERGSGEDRKKGDGWGKGEEKGEPGGR